MAGVTGPLPSLDRSEPATGHREAVRDAQARAYARAALEPSGPAPEPVLAVLPSEPGDHDALVETTLHLFPGSVVVYDHEQVQGVWFDRHTRKPLNVG